MTVAACNWAIGLLVLALVGVLVANSDLVIRFLDEINGPKKGR